MLELSKYNVDFWSTQISYSPFKKMKTVHTAAT